MKKMRENILSIFLTSVFMIPTAFSSESAVAEEGDAISYNIGYMSEYWYRGVHQSDSAVSFGADYEVGGFYLGTWWADVDTGLELTITVDTHSAQWAWICTQGSRATTTQIILIQIMKNSTLV